MPERYLQPVWERVAMFVSGIVLIGALLWIALVNPSPTNFQYTIFRVVLALGGGAFAALIPGTINFKYRDFVRAGGALAVLAIIYFCTTAPPTVANPDFTTHGATQIDGDCNVVGTAAGSISCNNGN